MSRKLSIFLAFAALITVTLTLTPTFANDSTLSQNGVAAALAAAGSKLYLPIVVQAGPGANPLVPTRTPQSVVTATRHPQSTATATRTPQTTATPTRTPSSSSDPVILFTGDSRSGCDTGAIAVAKLLDTLPSAWPVLFNGDATNTGAYSEFTTCYNTTYGRHKAQIKPVPGNHEYDTSGGSGYFQYYGSQAGVSGKGYYSFDVGSWHIVALNTEIAVSSGSAEEQWLKADLAAHPSKCTLAYWHEPRFSSGEHQNNTFVSALWTDLYNANAEIVMNGHDHDYERLAPQNPSGALDNARGIREFVVGTGGVAERPFGTIQPNSQLRNNTSWGIVKLTLHPTSYDWQFLPVAGSTLTDSGTTVCH